MILNEEATNVSQGQKQLITIARAILQDPKFLFLMRLQAQWIPHAGAH